MFRSSGRLSAFVPSLRKSLFLAAALAATFLATQSIFAAEIGWRRDLQASLRESALHKKPILVVVGATWCGYCRQLQQETLRDPKVMARVNSQYIPVYIDADEQPAVTEQLQVESMPTVLVISPERRIVSRSAGYQTASELDATLAKFKPATPTIPRHGRDSITRVSHK